MRPRRAVPKIPPKSSVPPRLPLHKSHTLLTHPESTLLQMLIPLHFNSLRINTYKKPGGGCPSLDPKVWQLVTPSVLGIPSAPAKILLFPPFALHSSLAATLGESLQQYHSMGLARSLFSYSYALFCHRQNTKSLIFRRFRTLCQKHPGWGQVVQRSLVLFTTHYSLLTVLPQNFYPPASDLRHNPAARGQHPQINPRTGRNQ